MRESVELSRGEALFDERRRAVLDLLGFSPEKPTVIGGNGDAAWEARDTQQGVAGVFLRLIALPDPALMDVIAVVMGETLAAGSAAVEALFSLLRDRELLGHMVAEVAGETVATANGQEKVKTLKQIIADHLSGADGRAKVERWVPRWMAFPPSAYTERGGVGTVAAHGKVVAARDLVATTTADAGGEPFAEAA